MEVRVMTIVRRPSPFGELLSLRSAMDRLFEDSFVRPRSAWTSAFDGGSSLPMDISTTSDELVVEASLPGLRPEDVDITVEGGTLTISAQNGDERKEQEGGYLLQEIRRGSFSRSVTLPEGLQAERASATFENGVLTLRIPKAEEVKPRQIRISPVSNGRSTDTSPLSANGTTTAEGKPSITAGEAS
jgi:HSP20 family protein